MTFFKNSLSRHFTLAVAAVLSFSLATPAQAQDKKPENLFQNQTRFLLTFLIIFQG